ncbi:Panacea domain-containing protein [Blastochloris tepida]|uniref:Antitoxin SocA-like Panacea domain-containing protein n=1 Tax=Blastochloris tepida TaxID=2233851 RepID=A0A348G447_9HYPH|nr:type II toxin-antitoxin system antitoxin SocA domain-containing protein [Blastochloris tepida]BBF94330.1 hypothetical protein BLTE_30150 [Blastochloris tepida]
MYDARAIANFFLDRAAEQGMTLTIMTLLKVLYFSHAWYLAKHNAPLVAQPFEAWRHGPVNRVVYDQFKEYGEREIDRRAHSFDPKLLKFVPTPYDFDEYTSDFLENIYDYYSKFHPFKLSHLTHEKGGPWDIVWSQAEKQAVPGMIIPNELISTWFKGKDALYWTDRERRMAT